MVRSRSSRCPWIIRMKKPRETLNRKDCVCRWSDIADSVSKVEGREVSRQAVISTHKRLLRKLRILLSSDPYIKDWMAGRGLEIKE